jgi:hypothetical protein
MVRPDFFSFTTFEPIGEFSFVKKVAFAFFIIKTELLDIISTFMIVGERLSKAILFIELEIPFVIYNKSFYHHIGNLKIFESDTLLSDLNFSNRHILSYFDGIFLGGLSLTGSLII